MIQIYGSMFSKRSRNFPQSSSIPNCSGSTFISIENAEEQAPTPGSVVW